MSGAGDPLPLRFARVAAHLPSIVTDEKAVIEGQKTDRIYKFAHLNSVLRLIKEGLAQELIGTSAAFEMLPDGFQRINMIFTCLNTGDELVRPGMAFKVSGDPQATGTSISYARRYSLVAIFQMEVEKHEDDDGAAGSRAETTPEGRTGAEREVRKIIADMTAADREEVQADFMVHFRSTLTNLPESKHGDALKFVKEWNSHG